MDNIIKNKFTINQNTGNVISKIHYTTISKKKIFMKLGNYNETTHYTRLVCVDEFVGVYSNLVFGNGCSWFRNSSMKLHRTLKIKENYKIEYNGLFEDDEKKNIENKINTLNLSGNGNSIKYIQICGLKNKKTLSRPIRNDIKKFYKDIPCASCGSNTELVCDHKNDLYNNPRVLNTLTQTIYDFQSLCNHCNLQKRQIAKNTKKNNKRYSAKQLGFPIGFLEGDENFDINDPNAMNGTYWYDPIAFRQKCYEKLIDKIKKLNISNYKNI